MRRRICLPLLAASIALGAPAAGHAQSSSQAQYQGVAPETQTPVTGGGPGGNGTTAGNVAGGGKATGSGGTATSGGGTSGASGNGGGGASAPASSAGQPAQTVAAPKASRDTALFSGGDILLIVLGCLALAGLGIVLRRSTHREPAGT